MQKFLTIYLLVTGSGAFVALTAPSLVVIGFFLLIIPGLILSVMPTAFLYGLIFAASWWSAKAVLGDGVVSIVAALALTAAVLFAVVQPTRAIDLKSYEASLLAAVTPPQPIALEGHVRFDLPGPVKNKTNTPGHQYVRGEAGFACEGHCMAALFTPGVTMVTINESAPDGDRSLSPEARTYRLAGRPGCEPTAKVDWDTIRAPLGGNLDDQKALAARWAMALATDACLMIEPAGAAADITVVERTSRDGGSGRWGFGPGYLTTHTVEIVAGDRLLHRAHSSRVGTLASFLMIEGSGGLENFGFGWARATIPRRPPDVRLDKSLSLFTNLAGRGEPETAEERIAEIPALREQLAAALDDPAATAKGPEFAVMERYFVAVGKAVDEQDVALTARLAADPRIQEFKGLYKLKPSLDQARTIYDAYTRRLIETGAPMEMARSGMQSLVSTVGGEADALIGPEQEKLLGDGQARLAVPELVSALGHGNQGDAERLLAILKEHAGVVAEIHRQREAREIGGYGRQVERDAHMRMLSHAKSGLCLIAPLAGGLRPELEAFLSSEVLPRYMVEGHEMTDWNVILVRMGKPIDAVSKPARMSGTEENYRRNLSSKIEGWRADRC